MNSIKDKGEPSFLNREKLDSDPGVPSFQELFDLSEIQSIQDAFAKATGVASIITGIDGRPITRPSNFCRLCSEIIRKTERGRLNCFHSDSVIGRYNHDSPTIQPCLSGGLWDAGASIRVGGKHIANWLIGQVRNEATDKKAMMDYARVIGADENEFSLAFDDVTIMSLEQFKNVSQTLFLFANQLSKLAYQKTVQEEIIVKQQKTEKKLSRSEAKYRRIYDNILDVYYEANLDGVILEISPSIEKYSHYKREDLLGKSFYDLYANPQDRERLMEKLFTRGSVRDYEIVLKDGDDSQIVCSMNIELVKDYGRNPIKTVGIFRDITERKQAEKEKLQAQQYAVDQEKHALLGQVAGKIAHDFNNILGVIMGNTELALMDCRDDQLRKTLELVFEQTMRGKNLTKNLVVFAKDQEIKQEFFNLNEKIDLVLSLLKKDLETVDVIRETGFPLPDLLADPGMIEHTLVNLIQNSLHAVGMACHPKIFVRSYLCENSICFEIEDNGCGIPEAMLETIYSPSFTLKGNKDVTGSYKKEIKGTGYGLANVEKCIEQHNGDLRVKSEVGSGTKFTICLPVLKKELTKEEKIEIRELKFQPEKKILLVEDEPAIFDVQYKLLTEEPFNHKVDIARDGQIALDLFEANEYDVVSLDYVLPGDINGMDVYHHIRKKNRKIPILFISGNLEFIESIKGLQEKDMYIDHLSKPCRNKDYVIRINRLGGLAG
jgi:two-component system cell cycle sensor histidine kinase/response regulator CckA